MASLCFAKYEGLGNDFVLIEADDERAKSRGGARASLAQALIEVARQGRLETEPRIIRRISDENDGLMPTYRGAPQGFPHQSRADADRAMGHRNRNRAEQQGRAPARDWRQSTLTAGS